MNLPLRNKGYGRASISILHHLPGRVRLRVSKGALDKTNESQFEKNLISISTIKAVTINHITSSVLIFYNNKSLTISSLINIVSRMLEVSSGNHFESYKKSQSLSSLKFLPSIPLAISGLILSAISPIKSLKPELLVLLLLQNEELKAGLEAFKNNRNRSPEYYLFLASLFEILTGRSKYRLMAFLIGQFTSLVTELLKNRAYSRFEQVFPEIPDQMTRLNPAGIGEIASTLEIRTNDRMVYHRGQTVFTDAKIVQGKAELVTHTLSDSKRDNKVEASDIIHAGDKIKEGKLLVRVSRSPYTSWLTKVKHTLGFSDELLNTFSSQSGRNTIIPTNVLQAFVYTLLTRDILQGMRMVANGYSTGLKTSIQTSGQNLVADCLNHGTLIPNQQKMIGSFRSPVLLIDAIDTIFNPRYQIKTVIPVVGDAQPERILELAGACEEKIKHPIADMIHSYLEENHLSVPKHTTSIHIKKAGTETVIDEMIIRTGNRRFMDQRGIPLKTAKSISDIIEGKGWMPIFVSVDQRIFGVIGIEKSVKREVNGFIEATRKKVTPHCYILSDTAAWYRQTIENIIPGNKYCPRDLEDFLAMLNRHQITPTVITTKRSFIKGNLDKLNIVRMYPSDILEVLSKSTVCLYTNRLKDLYFLFVRTKKTARMIESNLNMTILVQIVTVLMNQGKHQTVKWNPVIHESIRLFNLLSALKISHNNSKLS